MMLTLKYRPRTLDAVFGQAAAVKSLKGFVARPHSVAFLFAGETGVGKTSLAYAIAGELGCSIDDGDMGGLYEIPSGEMDADAVRSVIRRLAFRPMIGTGWRVLICNETDRMSKAAETIWLDALEHLGPQTVIVFTTNRPEVLSKRFSDRCECFELDSATAKLRPALREFSRRVWRAETGTNTDPPAIDVLGVPTLSGPDSMHASFRLALNQLQKLLREHVGTAGGSLSYGEEKNGLFLSK